MRRQENLLEVEEELNLNSTSEELLRRSILPSTSPLPKSLLNLCRNLAPSYSKKKSYSRRGRRSSLNQKALFLSRRRTFPNQEEAQAPAASAQKKKTSYSAGSSLADPAQSMPIMALESRNWPSSLRPNIWKASSAPAAVNLSPKDMSMVLKESASIWPAFFSKARTEAMTTSSSSDSPELLDENMCSSVVKLMGPGASPSISSSRPSSTSRPISVKVLARSDLEMMPSLSASMIWNPSLNSAICFCVNASNTLDPDFLAFFAAFLEAGMAAVRRCTDRRHGRGCEALPC